MDTLIQIKNLFYQYEGGEMALKNVNMDIYPGERIAVLGANGAGKSTFFLNLNGVLRPSKGSLSFQGRMLSSSKADLNLLRSQVGIVFQDADNQIIASTVYKEISFGPMNLKLEKEEVAQRVEKAMDTMNITSLRSRPPHFLSGGEKKKVTIADIIAMEPELIIFDEPTSSLDPVNVAMLEEVLEWLSKQGKTILISTHDVDFAYRWADRIVVFAEGGIIADDTVEGVFENKGILKEGNLRRPMMMEFHQVLMEMGINHEDIKDSKTMEELKKALVRKKEGQNE